MSNNQVNKMNPPEDKYDQSSDIYRKEGREYREDTRRASAQNRTWEEYRELVLQEIERINRGISDLSNRLDRNYHEYQAELSKLKIDMAMIQVKTGLWGGTMGAAAGILTALAFVLFKH
jgi:intergrase/recombinase